MEYKSKNKDKSREKNKFREKTDPAFKLIGVLRKRLLRAIKSEFKTGSSIRGLGCSIKEFKLYIESKFYCNPETGESMIWENHGLYGWHIDHVKPLSLFDLTNTEHLKAACHYTNLQPLWAKQNLSKGAKFFGEQK